MEQKKVKSVLFGCAAAFLIALIVILCMSRRSGDRMSAGSGAVVISEVLANNFTYPAPDGRYLDCVELCNLSDEPVDISGYVLSDHPDEAGYVFPKGTVLPGGGYILCWCDKLDTGGKYGRFGISADGDDTIYLYNTANVCIDSREIPYLQDNHGVMLSTDGAWKVTDRPTPGFSNDEAGYEAYMKQADAKTVDVVISEVMSDGCTTVRTAAGQFCDWVELYNRGTEAAALDGFYLSDDPARPLMWKIPTLTLQPGERTVICCAGQHAGQGEADFALSKDGGTVLLTGTYGQPISQVSVPALEKDHVYALQENGSYTVSAQATPGLENTQQSYLQYLDTLSPEGALVISEVMSSNSRYLQQSDGKFYDWVELCNCSDEELSLGQYFLSNDKDDMQKFRLPDLTLQPGKRIVVICSGVSGLSGIQAPFTLSREGCQLYVCGPDGLSDRMFVHDVPYGGSMGREEHSQMPCYFRSPTPDSPNGEGMALLSTAPRFVTGEGIYEDVSQLHVELEGSNIRYTMDGSEPTWDSPVYEGAITVTAPVVIRAASFVAGQLPSRTVTASYILNGGHELPVLSLAVDPGQMFGGSGMYRNYLTEQELPCNLKLFETDGGFSVDCGIKMHGHTGLTFPKKSFKVNFRGQYGQEVLGYPVYGQDGVQLYSSLCIRAGQDYPSAIFRDELFAALCREMGDRVLTQQAKCCVLYINGEYFGIYCLKEAFSETYYAENRHVSPESVSIAQAPVSPDSEFGQLLEYCKTHDLSVQENYDYVAQRVNVEAMIDWMIIEGYSCNSDIQQNLRYFKSTEDGNRWTPALYDLDWTFYSHDPFYHVLCAGNNWQHTILTRALLQNAGFREQFLSRLSWAMEGVLSNENVLAHMDSYQQLLAHEVPAERQRWEGDYNGWIGHVNRLRDFITLHDHQGRIVENLRKYIGLTDEECETYFGRWV